MNCMYGKFDMELLGWDEKACGSPNVTTRHVPYTAVQRS